MLRYNIDDRQQPIREAVAEFAQKEIVPKAVELDRRPEPQEFPLDYYRLLAKQGYIGFPLPKEYGGGGRSAIEYTTLCEELNFWDGTILL